MRSVISILALVASSVLAVAYSLYQQVPQPVANSVVAEKGEGGGRVATVLPDQLSNDQHRLLNMAYEVAKSNGLKSPEIVQAVLLQETQAGGLDSYRVANPGPNAYFGIMQIKLAAARDVLARSPKLFDQFGFHTRTDDEIKANLILNDRFNLEIATRYLKLLQTEYGFRGRELLNAYNRGPGGVKEVDGDFHYAKGAEAKLVAYKQRQ